MTITKEAKEAHTKGVTHHAELLQEGLEVEVAV